MISMQPLFERSNFMPIAKGRQSVDRDSDPIISQHALSSKNDIVPHPRKMNAKSPSEVVTVDRQIVSESSFGLEDSNGVPHDQHPKIRDFRSTISQPQRGHRNSNSRKNRILKRQAKTDVDQAIKEFCGQLVDDKKTKKMVQV